MKCALAFSDAGWIARLVFCVVLSSLIHTSPTPLRAAVILVRQGEGRDTTAAQPSKVFRLTPVIVTATRTAKDVFEAPVPASVLGRSLIRELVPNSASDLFRDLQGLDVSGVGTNQVRPMIRGQRGQRILLVEDGMRLNNSRRQQDFGEIPGLIDVSSVERVEVVRGPASVLYGTDAIGGVVNLVTRTPTAEGLHGTFGYRFSTHDTQHKGTASLEGRFGRLAVLAHGTYRDADRYEAPAGSFGNITLSDETPVFDTGVQDESFALYAGYDLAERHGVFAKIERYRADTAGFGYVDPDAYAPGSPLIQIVYPFQRFDKYTVGYKASRLGAFLADNLDVVGYFQDNERRFDLNVAIAFPPPAPPGSGVEVNSQNFTDLSTLGLRLEARKLAVERVLLTYGVDFFRDDSKNTDSSATTITGFGPPSTQVSTTSSVPNATFRSVGAFAQGDIQLAQRASLILGVRYQHVRAATKETPGLSDPLVVQTDRTLVGTANAVYGITRHLNVVASVGRAFRSPNLVERFFKGPTPEGAAFQAPNPNLEPETSLNVDLGLRYRDRLLYLEGFVFRNTIRNGIRISATGDSVMSLAVFQNVNVDKLRFWGIELAGDARLSNGLSVGASYTHLSSKDVLDPSNPVGESFDDKVAGRIRYTHPSDRFWAEYRIRRNGERKDVDLGVNPLGATLPAFTVHTMRGGVTVFRRGPHVQRLGITVQNLTNELYAEFANAGFFRPEPRRSVIVTWDMTF